MTSTASIRPGLRAAQAVHDDVVDGLTVGEVVMLAELYRLASRAAAAEGAADLAGALGMEAALLRSKVISWAERAHD